MTLRDKHIKQIAKGDVEIFKLFYEALFQPLSVFSYSFLKNESEAEDLAQDLFITYWNKRREFESVDLARAFLYKTAKNKCLNIIRSQKVHQKFFEHILNNEVTYTKQKIIENETYTLLHQSISDLPTQTKRIIRLSLAGLKNKEIADHLNISINTVKTLKGHGYTTLRQKLSNNMQALVILSLLLN
uniref:sigma-70 family RNA polymerase sigma factor n=1 Tax=uncultured Draconibacterium sp. TaxID=1573823 RepID=UPI00321638FB